MATEASSALQSHAATLPLTHQIVAPVAVGARPVVLATWAVFLALLLSLAWRQRLRLRENLPFLAQALGVVTLGALTILGFAPRAPLHEYAEFNHATEPFFAEWPTAYGETLNALALAVDQVLRQGVPSLFLVNGVLATGAIAAIIALTLALFADRQRALLAGLLLALSPVCVRYAASEEPFAALTCLVAVSLAAWRVWLDRRKPLLLALSVVAAALAMQLRPDWLLLPIAHLTLARTLRRDVTSSRRALGLAALVLLALLSPQLWVLAHAPQRAPHFVGLLPQKVGAGWLLFHWRWTSIAGLVLVWLALRARPRAEGQTTQWLLAFYAGATVLPFAFYASPGPFTWRMQILPSALLAVLLADAPRGLVSLPTRWRLPTVVALGALQFATHTSLVRADLPQQQEWRFLAQTVPQLPPAVAITSSFADAAGRFPHYLLDRAALHWQELDASAPQLAMPPDDQPHVVYLGLWCWMRPQIVHGTQLNGQTACARLRDRYDLRPIAESNIAPSTLIRDFTQPTDGLYRVGFYWAQRKIAR